MSSQLKKVGIETPEQLCEVGSKAAWLRIKKIDDSACFNRLCGLEGAIRGVRWHTLPASVKDDLKEYVRHNKDINKKEKSKNEEEQKQ